MEVADNGVHKKDTAPDNRKFQLIVFKLGEEEYGLHIDQIKEVVRTPAITRLPQTPPYVKGVANIRGNIIAIVDLEEKFGLGLAAHAGEGSQPQVAGKYTLVLESEEVKAGILVKEVPNTLNVTMAELEDVANLVNDGSSEQSYIKGIVKRENRLIIMIDIFRVMNGQELAGLFKRNVQTVHA